MVSVAGAGGEKTGGQAGTLAMDDAGATRGDASCETMTLSGPTSSGRGEEGIARGRRRCNGGVLR